MGLWCYLRRVEVLGGIKILKVRSEGELLGLETVGVNLRVLGTLGMKVWPQLWVLPLFSHFSLLGRDFSLWLSNDP